MTNPANKSEPLLEVQDLKKYFPIKRGFFKRVVGHVKAVDDINLHIMEGETLGMVGESGCGKTTAGRSIMRAITPSSGKVMFRDPILGLVDVAALDDKDLMHVRRSMRMIFQDPYASLNPRMTILDIVGAPLRAMGLFHGKQLEDRVAEILDLVGLRPEYMRRYPHAFSGGQRQRIGIARALAVKPEFLVCDEAVAALDVSIQAQILNLFMQLRADLDLTYLFISHDLGVVEHLSDRVVIMYLGRVVEQAPSEEVFARANHPYTKSLLSAVPRIEARKRVFAVVKGEIPSPLNPPSGCHFHPRCPHAMERCKLEVPRLREIAPGHLSACHLNG